MGREGRGGEGRGVDQHSTWKLSFLRWEGRGGEGRGDGGVDQHSTWKLSFVRWRGEGRGGGIDRHSTWKLSFLRWGGRGGEGRGVDRHSTWKLSFLRWGGEGRGGGSIDTHFESEVGITLQIWGGSTLIRGVNRHSLWKWSWDYLADLGGSHWSQGGQSTLNLESEVGITLWIRGGSTLILGGVNQHSTWKGSAKTLEGLLQLGKDPQDLGRIASMWKGSAKTLEGSPQLGKDLQRPWKDRINVERIRNDFGRIASTWKGSAMTLEGLPELGKDPQWLWKDRLCQCWSWGDWGDFESEVGITLQIWGRLTLALKVKLGLPCGSGVDRHWSGGVNRHSLWKWSWDYLADPGWIDTDPGGGRSTLTLKVKLGLPCGSRVDRHWSWVGSIDTHFESEVEITLRIRGGSTLILGGFDRHSLWKWSWDYLADPWWIDTDPGWGGSIDTHFESEVGITLQIRGGLTLILGGGRSTLNLERIRNDFGRIASATADPGGGHLSAPDIPCTARVGH